MRIGDEIYVRGIVDEIGVENVIVATGGLFLKVRKEKVVPKEDLVSPRQIRPSEWIFAADAFTVVIYDNQIHVIDQRDPSISVTVERNYSIE